MKKLFSFCIPLAMLTMLLNSNALCQASFSGHIGFNTATDWCGWSAGSTIPFQLRTDFPQNIEFFTNGNAATNKRMSIMGNNTISAWGNNLGWVGIGATRPLSMLAIGSDNGYNGDLCNGIPSAGWRSWMSVGTFMTGITTKSSDQMYVGLKREADDRDDAVINWGDNTGTDSQNPGPDNLRFIFTEVCESGQNNQAVSQDGLEMMRIVPYNSNTAGYGYVGIGTSFYTSGNNPQRKLEIHDATNLAQLRLSYSIGAASSFTDFWSDGVGNLHVNPSGGLTGIGTVGLFPQYTLHVFGNAGIDNVPNNPNNLNTMVWNTVTHQVEYNPNVGGNVNSCLPINAQYYLPKFDFANSPHICDTKVFEDNIFRNVGIDYNGYNISTAKLNVNFTSNATTTIGIASIMSSGINSGVTTGMYGWAKGTTGSLTFIGVKGEANGNVPGPTNIGVWGISNSNFVQTTPAIAYGVYGLANSNTANKNWGVYGVATFAANGYNHGVHGKVAAAGGGTGDVAGYFDGDVYTTAAYYPSDEILKENILPVSGAIDNLLKLEPSTYNYKVAEFSNIVLPKGDQIGLIAEKLKEIYPQLVKELIIPADIDSNGNQISDELKILSVNYVGLVPILIAGLQEQNKRIDDLQAQLDGCCGGQMKIADSNSPSQHIDLTAPVKIQLGNCIPNPSNGETTIPFHVPDNIVKAEIVFTDLLGNEFNRVEITARGYSSLSVSTSELEDGAYNYSLFADGKLIDTKQMLKQH